MDKELFNMVVDRANKRLNLNLNEMMIDLLKLAISEMYIDLDILYNLDDSDFIHEINGLLNNFDRVTKTCLNFSLKSGMKPNVTEDKCTYKLKKTDEIFNDLNNDLDKDFRTTEEKKAILKKWQDNETLLACRHIFCDDYNYSYYSDGENELLICKSCVYKYSGIYNKKTIYFFADDDHNYFYCKIEEYKASDEVKEQQKKLKKEYEHEQKIVEEEKKKYEKIRQERLRKSREEKEKIRQEERNKFLSMTDEEKQKELADAGNKSQFLGLKKLKGGTEKQKVYAELIRMKVVEKLDENKVYRLLNIDVANKTVFWLNNKYKVFYEFKTFIEEYEEKNKRDNFRKYWNLDEKRAYIKKYKGTNK